jgi:membrane protein YdbS with pleckstrin-like domain
LSPVAQTRLAGRNRRTHAEAARVRPEQERVYLDSRRHGIVLLPALVRAFAFAAAGGFLVSAPWPLPAAGALLVLVAALFALRTVWRWEQTRVVLTDETLAVVRGTFRRRTAAVRLERVGAVEVDQTLLGRVFGYGTVTAGPLAITHVPQPRNVYRLVESLSP